MQRLSSFFKYLTQQPPDVMQITPNLLDLRMPSSPAGAVAAIQNFIAFIPPPQVKFVQFFNCADLDGSQLSGIESVPVPLHGLGFPCFDDAHVDFGYTLSMAHVVSNWIQVNPVSNMAIILSSNNSMASTAVFVAAVLLLRGERATAHECLELFTALRRSSNGVDLLLDSGHPLVIPGWRAVHSRFIDILNVCALQRALPNMLPLRLLSVTIHSAPAFAASGSGWNPHVAISSVQQGQERLLWASAQAETASGAGSAEADSSQRGGAAGYSACPPQMHLRGTDLMFNCDTVLSGDICFTASHVVGRGLRNKVPAFSLCFNSFFAPDAWGWRCESSDEQSQSLSREFFRSKVVFQLRQLDISPAVIDRFPKGFFVSFDVIPQLDAPLQQCAPLEAYVSALQKQRLRSSIPYVVTYIMRPIVLTSSWGLEGLGIIVIQRHSVLILSSGIAVNASKHVDHTESPNFQATNLNISVPLSVIRECRVIETEDIDITASERYMTLPSEHVQQKRRLCARVTWTDLSSDSGSCSVCIHARNFDESIDFVREYIAAAIMHDAEETGEREVGVPSRGGSRKSPVPGPPPLASAAVEVEMPLSLPALLVNAHDHGELVPVDSKLLTETDVLQLLRWLPPRYVDRHWRLVYTAGAASAKLLKKGVAQKQDGFSIQSLFENMRSCGTNSPVISVIRDEKGYIFGVFSTEPWRDSPRSFGCGETFVFKLQPEAEMFRWSRAGEEFLHGTKTYISVGGGKAAALWLDDELNIGSSGECSTFDSPCLAHAPSFKCMCVEMWELIN